MIQTKALKKQYGVVTAVDGLELQIREGERFGLLGINGAGKSTTVKTLSGLTRPTSGEIFIGGYRLPEEGQKAKRLLGVSPQETAVAPNLSVRENLELLCGIYGLDRRETKQRIGELAEQFGLGSQLDIHAGKLSGGWQRRLSIAMAMVSRPKLLFLDEPTLGLDVIARSELWELIRNMPGTVLLTTHYMEEAEALCHRIGIMKDGKLRAVGTARELMAQTGTHRFEDAFIAIAKEGSL